MPSFNFGDASAAGVQVCPDHPHAGVRLGVGIAFCRECSSVLQPSVDSPAKPKSFSESRLQRAVLRKLAPSAPACKIGIRIKKSNVARRIRTTPTGTPEVSDDDDDDDDDDEEDARESPHSRSQSSDDDEYIAPSDESEEDGLDVAAYGRKGCCVIGCKSDCKCKCRDSNCIRMLCNEHATESKRLCHTCGAKRAAIRNNRN
jgi:hypothetical protein